ncbi:hypothetical protein [Maridesulfovibrio bastinii]|uniref:hypothetical protein n=1 Tax=Maridesulfovibrio bastinii TaxID=47157 RepID=UPI0003F646C2|nr:hypothetical protein [Maridesulfovibrio bastinii]
MADTNLLTLLKRVVELAMPDLRAYYRVVRKAKVVRTYPSDGRYWADVQPLRNDESVNSNEPVIPHVEIPIIWGGAKRGIVCPPAPDTLCDLEYYDGDPDFPRISNFRWKNNQAPDCEVDAFIIQQTPGVSIKIDAQSNVITLTPANRSGKIGENDEITVGKSWTIIAGENATIKAPIINQIGDLNACGTGGVPGNETKSAHTKQNGSYVLDGPQTINGTSTVNGDLYVSGKIYGDLEQD